MRREKTELGLAMALGEARARLMRARQNVDNLKLLLAGSALPEQDRDAVSIKPRPDGKTFGLFARVSSPPEAARLMISDIVHDARTALDYMIYRLAVRVSGESAARSSRKLCFLACDTPDRFKTVAGQFKKFLGDAPIAAMERLQKYKGLDARSEVLWELSELDNISKHRMIVVLHKELTESQILMEYKGVRLRGEIRNPQRVRLDDGAEIAAFAFPRAFPPDKVQMNLQATLAVAFTDSNGACDGKAVLPTLRSMVDAAGSVVDDFEREFFSDTLSHASPPFSPCE